MTEEAVAYLEGKTKIRPRIGMVLGTGLGSVADAMEISVAIPYEEIPHFPTSTVKGHRGRLLFGRLAGVEIVVMQGRIHFYEGVSMEQLALPVRVLRRLGVEILVLTNASGGISADYTPGDLVVISDHIKLDLDSPLRGRNPEEFGPRFFDMTAAYTPALREVAKKAAMRCGFSLPEGVYAYMGGPQFETPAEIRMLRLLGADLVGMSTVPEAITAVHCGMKVLAISCVTNMAAGMENGGLNAQVISGAENEGAQRMELLLTEVVKEL